MVKSAEGYSQSVLGDRGSSQTWSRAESAPSQAPYQNPYHWPSTEAGDKGMARKRTHPAEGAGMELWRTGDGGDDSGDDAMDSNESAVGMRDVARLHPAKRQCLLES
jgi:hypothetical protein